MLHGLGIYRFEHVQLPGRAGELQREEASAALVRELADNYGSYHGFLANELAGVGERARLGEEGDQKRHFAAWGHAHEIVMVEALLRACLAFRREGRPLDAPLDTAVPLLDRDDRLVSMLDANGATGGG